MAFCLVGHPAAWWAWFETSHVTAEYSREWTIIYIGVAVLATGLFNRLLTGWLITQIAIGTVFTAAVFKERLLKQPLLAHDVVFFVRNARENRELLWAYPSYTLVGIVALVAAMVVIAWCARKESAAISFRRARGGFVHALVAIMSSLVVPKAWSHELKRQSRFQDMDIVQAAVDLMDSRGANAVPRFVVSFWQFEIIEPYNALEALRFRALAAKNQRMPTRAAAVKPDIMVVLRESHANLRQLWETDRLPSASTSGHARLRWSGEARAHSFGGGTWLAEFSFLTGFYWADFGPAGSYAPFTLAPRMRAALPVQLNRIGYRTVVFYPVRGTFLNSRAAYRYYGFEEFYSSDDLGLTDKWLELSDQMIYSSAVQRLRETSDGRPVFAFILTIKNHGPHDRKPVNSSTTLPVDFPPPVRDSISDYLDRQEESERDFAWLENQWFDTTNPRILAAFGDHWPSLEGGVLWLASRAAPESHPTRRAMHTPLEFYANYTRVNAPRMHTCDLAFVGATLLEFAGLEPGELFSGNLVLRDHCAGAYVDASDRGLVRGYLTWANEQLGAWR